VSAPEGEQEPGGPERRFYALTDEGRVALAEELGRLQSILDTAAGKALVSKPV
jgi:DNA-binding PadR family transcriptional regulator